MIDVTPDQIAVLGDSQLRSLIALLCEAELRSAGHSTAFVTWGGNQDARDGGIDVRVDLPVGKSISGFVPKPQTGFQVKKQPMAVGEIAAEMAPKGALRPSISELGRRQGAYVIVSSGSSTSDSELMRRRAAMVTATSQLRFAPELEFYDRTRIASWVRNHAGVVLWVREMVGQPVQGWAPFGPWSYPAGGVEAEFLVEPNMRVRVRANHHFQDGLSVDEGIRQIREILSKAGGTVRLIGLSGVGKTRFAQALFDQRIGDCALDRSLAVYTNLSNDPVPTPFALTSELLATGRRAVLILDNCPSDLHARLSQLVRADSSNLSLLSIEYDIRDDQPEGTDVYELRGSEPELIRRLVSSRYPQLSGVDGYTIADFSGGNARIAIALADTVGRSGSLASLSDSDLFERLFQQRHAHDKSLLRIAQACSLMYSFNGEDVEPGPDGDLSRLAALAGSNAVEVVGDVAELLRRDLAQRRGKWRAILPHAIANRLASRALEDIPQSHIEATLLNGASHRVVTSFARRLGYLPQSPAAKDIAKKWLSATVRLGSNLWNLRGEDAETFTNLLPAVPEAALQAFEATVPSLRLGAPAEIGTYVPGVLRSIAWEAKFFEPAVRLLEFVATSACSPVASEAIKVHKSLFYACLSGTHATPRQRADAVRTLLTSSAPERLKLAAEAIDAMLKSTYFTSDYEFRFGAQSRDFGYVPSSEAEVADWYSIAVGLAYEASSRDRELGEWIKVSVAEHLEDLWRLPSIRGELERLAHHLAAEGYWQAGWLASAVARRHQHGDQDAERRLSLLEASLAPTSLVERVKAFVFTPAWSLHEFDDAREPSQFDSYIQNHQRRAEELGREAALDLGSLSSILSEIASAEGDTYHFGVGLATGGVDARWLYSEVCKVLSLRGRTSKGAGLLQGFLSEVRKTRPDVVDELLDLAVDEAALADLFPALQTAQHLDRKGLARLVRALASGMTPASSHIGFQPSFCRSDVPPGEIGRYLVALARAEGGLPIVFHILSMDFMRDRNEGCPNNSELVDVGTQLLCSFDFDREGKIDNYHLVEVACACLGATRGDLLVSQLCNRMIDAFRSHRIAGFDVDELLRVLFSLHSIATLNALLGGHGDALTTGVQLLSSATLLQPNPMDVLSDAELLTWCNSAPEIRFHLAAMVASVFKLSRDHNPVQWAPLAAELVHRSPDSLVTLKAIASRMDPNAWSGPRSTLLADNCRLLREFDCRGQSTLAEFVERQSARLEQEAREVRHSEASRDKERDERFE